MLRVKGWGETGREREGEQEASINDASIVSELVPIDPGLSKS